MLFIFIISIVVLSITSLTAQENTNLIIDLSSKSVESGKNFSVSVYDPQIQNGTPYLVNVTILFNNTYYFITSDNENGEIWLKAPKVDSYRLFTIEAFTENKMGNISIVVVPSIDEIVDQLVITTESYLVNANEQFMVIVTDQFGNPIKDAVVSLKNEDNTNDILLSDSDGQAVLVAPNKKNVTILAQKQGYEDAIETISITMKPSYIDSFLSNPQTPIFIALSILILSIVYVSIINPFIKNKKMTTLKINISKKLHTNDKSIKLFNNDENNSTFIEMDKTIKPVPTHHFSSNHRTVKKKGSESFQWFPSKRNDLNPSRSDKQQISNITSEVRDQTNIDEIHKKIDTMILEKTKKKVLTE